MPIFAVQYLENSPELPGLPVKAVREWLRSAFARLPISLVLLGWHLPTTLFEACAEETARAGAKLYRWHPLLTNDGSFAPPSEWQTIGLNGEAVMGFRNLPEFTFMCPNRLEVREAVLSHLEEVIRSPLQGVFLDRIRFPASALNPSAALACFCEACCQAAAGDGLDLRLAQKRLQTMLSDTEGRRSFVRGLLASQNDSLHENLEAVLAFRGRSISRLLRDVSTLARGRGVEVGLDCFSPCLTRMVGQDLRVLDGMGDWIKIMTYGHVLGPAGLPYELLGLASWLGSQAGMGAGEALRFLAEATSIPLPDSSQALRREGLSSQALQKEAERARSLGVQKLLAGIELVEIEGVAELNDEQIRRDLHAFKQAGVDGYVLSWDLWHIPLDRVELVREVCTG
jgi:hypothetical protein